MSRVSPVPYALTRVEWEDSAQPVPGWQWAHNYESPEVVKCVSVGYLIAETKQALVLAPNVGGLGSEQHQVSGIIRIPRSAVRRMTRLKG